jgi:hypothetical protein
LKKRAPIALSHGITSLLETSELMIVLLGERRNKATNAVTLQAKIIDLHAEIDAIQHTLDAGNLEIAAIDVELKGFSVEYYAPSFETPVPPHIRRTEVASSSLATSAPFTPPHAMPASSIVSTSPLSPLGASWTSCSLPLGIPRMPCAGLDQDYAKVSSSVVDVQSSFAFVKTIEELCATVFSQDDSAAITRADCTPFLSHPVVYR